jgi:hypothetical protein
MTVWYDALGEARPEDAAWELYHENSKSGRRAGLVPPESERPLATTPSGLNPGPAIPLGAPTALTGPSAAARLDGSEKTGPTLADLSALLSFGGGRAFDGDLIETWVHVVGVADLADGLYRHDRPAAGLRLVSRGNLGAQIASATVAPSVPPPLQVFIAGNLARAFALHGEPGYRRALLAGGAHTRELTFAAAGLRFAATLVAFYDREVDAILGLDGLAEGTLAVLAVAGPKKE